MKTLFVSLCLLVCLSVLAQKQYWGVTSEGGNSGHGTIFQTDSAGNNHTIKHHFFRYEGENAQTGALVQATDGKLYGMVSEGGMYDFGVLFQYDAATGTYVKKVDFNSTGNGRFPFGSLVAGPGGKLYGMTSQGGVNDMGVLFEYDLNTSVLTKRIDFDGTTNGKFPTGSLVLAGDGNFYGLTSQGGTTNDGVCFQYNPLTYVLTPKFEFSWSVSGSGPTGSLMLASNGNLYGVTRRGGASGNGAIIQFNPVTTVFTRLYDFTVSANGYYPVGTMIQATNGKLYGMTQNGGLGAGVVFQLDLVAQTYTAITAFDGVAKGNNPNGSLMQATDGLLYGMTYNGGTSNRGVLFRVDPTSFAFTKILDFVNNQTTGNYPKGTLMQASNGKIYGMTSSEAYVYGGLFELDPVSLVFSRKFDFARGPSGGFPVGSLMQARDGKIYGLAYAGGINEKGVLFQYNIQNNTYSVKYHFAGNGIGLSGSLVEGANGELYGLSYGGGATGNGMLFSFNYVTGIYTQRADFNGAGNGAQPNGSLFMASDGKLYGLTLYGGVNNLGVLFQYDPVTSVLTKKIDFNSTNGANPNGSLMQASDGMLYGLTNNGGSSGVGSLFQYNPVTGVLVTKYNFGGSSSIDGEYPKGNLTQAANGNLYGMTSMGGNNFIGVVFQYNPVTSVYTKKADLNNIDGSSPESSLMRASNGKLYGMTYKGGTDDKGVLLQFDPTTSSLVKKLDFNGFNGAKPVYSNLIEIDISPLLNTASTPSVCPGNSFSIPYTKSFTNGSGNIFTAQLSNAAGSFENPVNIGSLTSTGSGTITGTIPVNTPAGTGYRVRVVGSNPIVIGSDNGVDIVVNPKPATGFSINQSAQCLNTNNVVVTDTSTISSGTFSRIWDLGNADTSTLKIVTKTFNNTGSYVIKLVATSNNGCKDSVSRTISINPSPKAGFTMSDTARCVNGNVFVLNDTSTFSSGSPSRLWTVNVSDTSTLPVLTKSFLTEGVQLIKLVSIGNNGCRDSVIKQVTVLPKPVVGFTINQPAQCLKNNHFVFGDTSGISSGVYNRLWRLGGNDTSTLSVVSIVRNDTGTYSIRLVAESDRGCKDSLTKTIRVNPEPRVGFTINNKEQCINENNYTFMDTSVVSSVGFTRNWNLGEGDSSALVNPHKKFTATGLFTIKLYVRSSEGCVDSGMQQVTINPKPSVGFSINESAQCLKGNNFMFQDTSSLAAGIISRVWNFGNNDTSSAATENKQFTIAGNFTVAIVVSSNKGCKDSVSKMITVNPDPKAGFNINDQEQCLNNNRFILSDTTVLSAGSYTRKWSIASDTFSTPQVNRVFGGIGDHQVKLFIESDKGCKDTLVQTVKIYPNPVAGFTINNTIQCWKNNEFEVEDTATMQGAGYSRVWDLGFGDTASAVIALQFFPTAGSFPIQLTTTNSFGCKDSVVKLVSVLPMPVISITQNNDSLIAAKEQGVTYQWLDCLNGNEPIAGATSAVFVAPRGGFYALAVQKQGCKDTSVCISVNTVGLSQVIPKTGLLHIYPNPSNGSVTIESAQSGKFEITDALGKRILEFSLDASNHYRLNMETLAEGVYFVIGLDGSVRNKLLITK